MISAVAANGVGAVYVYDRSGTQWKLTEKLPNPAPNPNSTFGTALALTGSTAVIGGATYEINLLIPSKIVV